VRLPIEIDTPKFRILGDEVVEVLGLRAAGDGSRDRLRLAQRLALVDCSEMR
jgi:hypothetical protein